MYILFLMSGCQEFVQNVFLQPSFDSKIKLKSIPLISGPILKNGSYGDRIILLLREIVRKEIPEFAFMTDVVGGIVNNIAPYINYLSQVSSIALLDTYNFFIESLFAVNVGRPELTVQLKCIYTTALINLTNAIKYLLYFQEKTNL
jgi:hypothetical protein